MPSLPLDFLSPRPSDPGFRETVHRDELIALDGAWGELARYRRQIWLERAALRGLISLLAPRRVEHRTLLIAGAGDSVQGDHPRSPARWS